MLDELPPIFVGKAEELKRVVKLMCSTTKESMKTMEMHMPPWRRYGYVLVKWFGLYKRTTSEAPLKKASDSEEGSARKRAVGFAPLPAHSYYCTRDFVSKAGSVGTSPKSSKTSRFCSSSTSVTTSSPVNSLALSFSCPNLKSLDLRFNEFEGGVPKELFDNDLDTIFINHNSFVFDLPDNFGDSPVSVIVLANNKFHGCVPASILLKPVPIWSN
ncbi:hypothetical protein RJ640_016326 [Escallonia rubra]|uniref:Uncharacterized protein n=1 Tax=Escallonia rubra TaxID=112253 RepID=A0AA88UN58_9ASTE|nr:hypothetical protein RJ640_016326 [Escallonia rubra]